MITRHHIIIIPILILSTSQGADNMGHSDGQLRWQGDKEPLAAKKNYTINQVMIDIACDASYFHENCVNMRTSRKSLPVVAHHRVDQGTVVDTLGVPVNPDSTTLHACKSYESSTFNYDALSTNQASTYSQSNLRYSSHPNPNHPNCGATSFRYFSKSSTSYYGSSPPLCCSCPDSTNCCQHPTSPQQHLSNRRPSGIFSSVWSNSFWLLNF